ncbi:MAG: SIS domain-containing protein [Succinivibrionaceae bacterium]|nr:SIS domain-containing protein [Succinivibrionaceae bacterium]
MSQSGETADTLAALRLAKTLGYLGSLAICNVDGSSLVRESDLSFMTRAGAEIGVASTKAFIAQLVSFLVLTGSMMSVRTPNNDNENFPNIISNLISDLRALPYRIEETLKCAPAIENMAQILTNKTNAIFLGRGWLYPIAMEGALKLKEISYIHAEAYAAGELKHGPVALIDSDMPVICVTPSNKLLDKIISNIQVVKARKGETFIVSDNESQVENIIPVSESNHILQISKVSDLVAPIVFTIPLQLLSYYVALLRGYDVDQPRNLAKSVTVE